MLQSKGIVKKIIVRDTDVLVAFPKHAGYFRVRLDDEATRSLIAESKDKAREVSFTFDRDLNILSIT